MSINNSSFRDLPTRIKRKVAGLNRALRYGKLAKLKKIKNYYTEHGAYGRPANGKKDTIHEDNIGQI